MIPEVKHLTRLRSADSIPQEALSFYEQREQLNERRHILRAIVDRYNELRYKIIDIEEPLIQPTLRKMDDILRPAETEIIWSDSSTLNYFNVVENYGLFIKLFTWKNSLSLFNHRYKILKSEYYVFSLYFKNIIRESKL